MHIGIPKETKIAERRIALTPEACAKLVNEGHDVHIEKTAGAGAGFPDDMYEDVGCIIEDNPEKLYASSEMIVKVKEPLESDLKNLTKDHLLFCYLHLASGPALVEKLKEIGLTAVAFETVVEDGQTPLLAPMSAIAGRLATQIGTWYLHAPRGGKGILLGGMTDFPDGKVTVVGLGVAGKESAILAHNMGAKVTVLDINGERLQEFAKEYPDIEGVVSTENALNDLLPETDILVGAVYVMGRKAPIVVTKSQVKLMKEGSVIVDISIDQGGCIETSKPCTHEEPVYMECGVIHSAITNMPAAAPRTASMALSNAILEDTLHLANGNWLPSLTEGTNVKDGELLIAL
jgi:alanine dehydrogenase